MSERIEALLENQNKLIEKLIEEVQISNRLFALFATYDGQPAGYLTEEARLFLLSQAQIESK